jgi:hypothetical protein
MLDKGVVGSARDANSASAFGVMRDLPNETPPIAVHS